MPKALIIGELDSSNLGDQAIFDGLSVLLREHGVAVAALGLESTSWYEGGIHAGTETSLRAAPMPLRQRMGRWLPRAFLGVVRLLYLPIWYLNLRARLRRLAPRLTAIDVAVIGGGGLFINNNWHFPLAVRLLCRMLRAHGIPYGFSGVGAASGLDGLSIRLFAPSVAGAAFVHTRDARASELIGRYFGLASVAVGPDYAIFCPVKIAASHTTPTDRVHIGINLMTPSTVHHSPAEYEAALELLHGFITANASRCRFTIFTTGYHEDRRAARRFVAGLPATVQPPEVHGDFTATDELLAFVAQLDAVVAMRLHAALFAAFANVPFIALAPDNKVSAFLAELGLDRFAQSPLAFSVAGLNVLVDDTNAFRPNLAGKLAKQRTAVEPLMTEIVAVAAGRRRTPRLAVLGTRGIPARHGGFETFVERLAPYLVQHGWEVTVYCQENAAEYDGPRVSDWQGVCRVHVPVRLPGALGTVAFDWKTTLHAGRERTVALTLGYNTAAFNALFRLTGAPNLINMDGIEWQRDKWSWTARLWLRLNERLACRFADHLIADNPAIAEHLRARGAPTNGITMIPYGADAVDAADTAPLASLGLEPQGYALVIARPEPDNSILEIVQAYCAQARRLKLVVLGDFCPDTHAYHRQVLDAANAEVMFPGAIYDKAAVASLRFHARLYIHGHKFGGTNPSLVEALGAGSPILAHDNPFNRWVAGQAARYFTDRAQCEILLDALLADQAVLTAMRQAARARHAQSFRWSDILAQYETLLSKYRTQYAAPQARQRNAR